MKVKSYFVAATLLLMGSAGSLAQQTPAINLPPSALNPGAALEDKIRQEKRQQRKQQQQQATQEDRDASEAEDEAVSEGPSFVLKRVNFSPSEYLSREDLLDLLLEYIGKSVRFADLLKLVDEINLLYREKGIYTATALLPQQQIKDGVVAVRLVEGRLGELRIEGNEYTDNDYIRSWLSADAEANLLDARVMESDLLVYNRVIRQQLQADLKVGEAFGLTDIVVQVQEPSRDVFQLFIDNQGYKSSGEDEIGALYQRQQLFTPGDRSLAYFLASEGMTSLSLGYNAAIGTSRWRLGGTGAYTKTNVIGAEFEELDIRGESIRASMEASHLTYSEKDMWFTTLLSANVTRSKTEGFSPQLQQVGEFSNYNFYQLSGGGEYTWFGPYWQFTGRGTFSANHSDDRLATDEDRTIYLTNGDTTTIFTLPVPVYFLHRLEGQYTPSEGITGIASFSIGGPTTVRGYSPGAVSGDYGWYQQIEAHYNGFDLPHASMDWFAFFDGGRVRGRDQFEATASAYGIGLSVTDNSWYRLDMTAAKAIKDLVPNQDEWTVFARLTCTCLN